MVEEHAFQALNLLTNYSPYQELFAFGSRFNCLLIMISRPALGEMVK